MEETASRPPVLPHKLAYDKHAAAIKDTIAQLVSSGGQLTSISLIAYLQQEKLLFALRALVERTDILFFKVLTDKGPESALAEPFWPVRGTWSFERFGKTPRRRTAYVV